jgi:MOSC domain-containing protein YiiM
MPLSFLTWSEEIGLKSLVSTKVMMGLGCFDASYGAPGGGVWAKVIVELPSAATVKRRKVTGRNIANIIIDSVQATVRAILIKKQKGGESTSLDSVQAVAGGLIGDHHTGFSKKRQILLLSGSVLDELKLLPGSVHENVVVDGIDVMGLQEGQHLRLGDALVTVTIPCEPCVQMERVRQGLQASLQDRRGMFVRVVAEGTVRVGDRVEILQEISQQSG